MKKLLIIGAFAISGVITASVDGHNYNLRSAQYLFSNGGYYTLTVTTSCGTSFTQKIWCDTPPTQADADSMGRAINYSECGVLNGATSSLKRSYSID